MDVEAMARRCPHATPLGRAELVDHVFFIAHDGYASIRRSAGAVVHGLAWAVPLHDRPALDRYEAVATGLYRVVVLPIRLGPRVRPALVYVGRSIVSGVPVDGYMEGVLHAAETLQLPPAYLDQLRLWCP